jgi:hypothetical protein
MLTSRELIMSAQVMYLITMMLVKFSFLALYRRVFPGRRLRQVLIVTALVVVAATVTWSFTDVFQCTPVHRLWDLDEPGTCIHIAASIMANGIFNIVSDVFILLLPLPMLWQMPLSQGRKWSLSSVFLLGSV